MHVAIIPDGNRRWAKAHGLSTVEGHEAGFQALKTLLTECRNDGPDTLSFYAFSTENFSRPQTEVKALFGLLDRVLESFTKELIENKILLHISGGRDNLDSRLLKKLDKAQERCALSADGKFTLNICLNYGAQQEITGIARSFAEKVQQGTLHPEEITTQLFEQSLFFPRPIDLLIRTSGEERISNFMLWQAAYAEFYFTTKLWPDFTPEVFREALKKYEQRQRRFGS
ncbi:MAG: polyprenyl diphosphate synthase [Brevinema sp.]